MIIIFKVWYKIQVPKHAKWGRDVEFTEILCK
jgi:hypothetical protein